MSSGEIYFDYNEKTRLLMGNTTSSLNDNTNKLFLLGATNQQNAVYSSSNANVYSQNGKLHANVFIGKYGENDIGTTSKPMFLNGGVFEECSDSLAVDITGTASNALIAEKWQMISL